MRSHSNSPHLWCDASDQNCLSKINKSVTDYESDHGGCHRWRPFKGNPTSCLAHPFSGNDSSLWALAPPPPSLAANTQLFGYLSRASIKGCHSASWYPWANQIRAPDHTQPSPRCCPPAMLITFKYSHRWPVLSWEERPEKINVASIHVRPSNKGRKHRKMKRNVKPMVISHFSVISGCKGSFPMMYLFNQRFVSVPTHYFWCFAGK